MFFLIIDVDKMTIESLAHTVTIDKLTAITMKRLTEIANVLLCSGINVYYREKIDQPGEDIPNDVCLCSSFVQN